MCLFGYFWDIQINSTLLIFSFFLDGWYRALLLSLFPADIFLAGCACVVQVVWQVVNEERRCAQQDKQIFMLW